MRKILIAALVIYLLVGVGLMLVHPKLSTTEELLATNKGKHCEPEGRGAVLSWPFLLKYYYGGGFEACRKSLYQ
jgi:hypothetical protein